MAERASLNTKRFEIKSQLYYLPVVLKAWSLSRSITWELAREASSGGPPQLDGIRNTGSEGQPSVFSHALQVILMRAQV